MQLSGVDASALRYRSLAMPKGRASMQMTLLTQGRSASALIGALSGSGAVTLEGLNLPGLDPRAFDVAIRASDSGQATDDTRLKQIVEPALAAGPLPVASAQIPFNIRDGRIRVGATTLAASGANVILSGGYDIPADQADIRAALASTQVGATNSRPEIQLLAVGTPDGLSRSIDIAALSSWLAVRAIDRETKRLDAIERGEPVPPPTPAALPPAAAPAPDASNSNSAGAPSANLPAPVPIRAAYRRSRRSLRRGRRLSRRSPPCPRSYRLRRLRASPSWRRCRRQSRSSPCPEPRGRGRCGRHCR